MSRVLIEKVIPRELKMPAIPPARLAKAITDAISDSGNFGQLVSSVRSQPRRFAVTGDTAPAVLTAYAWTLTFGGRPTLPNEYRIQMTSVDPPLVASEDGPTILIGYDPDLNLFAGFDFERHKDFTPGSPSLQIDRQELRRAERDGLSFNHKTNEEIAVGIRPDMLLAYAANAADLHRYGGSEETYALLTRSLRTVPSTHEIEELPIERQRIIREVSKLARSADFRQRILFAYGNRCAVTRTQLRLVDAAHILPVGAQGSTDHVRNGIALAPTYHRAFDAGLIYLNEQYQMMLNEDNLNALDGLGLSGGIELFRAPLETPIFLPPDPQQRPSLDMIRRANRFRNIA